MNLRFLTMLVILMGFVLINCNNDDVNGGNTTLEYSFDNNTEGWIGDFADYPDEPDVENFYALQFEHSNLPAPLEEGDGALKQSGNNHSDDLFMFIKKKVEGLEKNQNYNVIFNIEIATNASEGSFGIGGSPASSVYIKAGASEVEPIKILDPMDANFRLNIDKGNQSSEGMSVKVIGNFSNGSEEEIYRLKQLSSDPIRVRSNNEGELWLIVGTDSGFEGTTTIYYNQIEVTLSQL